MRDLSSRVHWLNARLPVVVATLISLVAAAGFGISAGEGDFRMVYIGLLGAAVTAVIMMLGDKYWLLLPFALTAQIPAVPVMGKAIELSEIMIMLCTVTFAFRYALKRQRFTLFHSAFAPILLYIAWAGIVFYGNPVGLDALGADTGGARFYIKLVLALASFLVIVNQDITERDCRIMIILAVFGSLLTTGNAILNYIRPAAGNHLAAEASLDPEAFYTWHQALAIVPIMIVMLLLARFRSSALFSAQHVGFLILLLVCCGLVLLSGKRTAVAAVPLALMAAAYIRKEYGFVIFWVTSAVVTLAAVVILHGTLFTLPMVAQRSLSWLPGRWDASLEGMKGGRDEFREGLRQLAIEKIKRDPWIGKGYAVDRQLTARLNSIVGFTTEKLVLLMAGGSSWHNTWLGYAADFGIPGSVLQAVIYLYVLWLGLRLVRRLPEGSMRHVFVFYVLLHTVRDVASSHHDGHSSMGPYLRFWMYAIVVALHLRPNGGSASPGADDVALAAAATARPRPARQPRRVPMLASSGGGERRRPRLDS
jgi:hypothetical protein